MKFDDILSKHVGEFGPYQKIQIVLVCLPVIFASMHSLSWTFTAATIPHRCIVSGENYTEKSTSSFFTDNLAYSSWLKKSKSWAECKRPKGFILNMSVSEEELENWEMEPCLDGDRWDLSEIKTTAIKKWHFVCENEWLKSTVHAFYYVGQFFGSFVFGIMADKFGRKPVFFMAVAIVFTCGTSMAFVEQWQLFTFLRFMVGFAHPAIFVTAVVMGVEMLGPSKRALASVMTNAFFAAGQIVLAGVAYTFRYYDQVQLAVSVPIIVFAVYWWVVPESARWLITRKRFREADKILRKIAAQNKTRLPEDWSRNIVANEKEKNENAETKVGLIDMFKTPNVRKHSLTLFVCWPIVSMAYYGLAMNPNFMGGDRYIPVVLSGSLEVVVSFILLSVLNVFGRKFAAVMGFLLAAVCLITSAFVPISYAMVRMICVSLGKTAISAVYAVLYLFTPELFPTVIRMTAVGACSMAARIGGFLSAYVFLWLARFYPTAVALGFSATCFFACCILLLLPDTNGQPQFETIAETEEFAKKNKKLFIFSWNIEEKPLGDITQMNEMKNRQ